MKLNYVKNMRGDLEGAAWRGHAVEVSSSEVLTSTDAGAAHQHERLFSSLIPPHSDLKCLSSLALVSFSIPSLSLLC